MGMHVKALTPGNFLDYFPPCLLRQDPSLNLQCFYLASVANQFALGSRLCLLNTLVLVCLYLWIFWLYSTMTKKDILNNLSFFAFVKTSFMQRAVCPEQCSSNITLLLGAAFCKAPLPKPFSKAWLFLIDLLSRCSDHCRKLGTEASSYEFIAC